MPERNQHQEPAGEGYFAREARPLGGNGFFYDLYHHLLAHLQRVLDGAVLLQVGKAAGLLDGIKPFAVALDLFQILCIGAELAS